ncbi:MAG: alpha-amylase, partial [Sphingobacteriaceae bacterium]
MKKFTILFLLLSLASFAQVTTVPFPALATGPVTLNFNKAGTPLATYNGTIYAHIGVTVNGEPWQNVKGTWGVDSSQPAMTLVSGTTYKLEITPDLYTYFGVPTSSTITQICVVFRAAGTSGQPQSVNYFSNVGAFQVTLSAPAANSTTILNTNGNLTVTASNTGGPASYSLSSNGVVLNTNASTSNYSFTHTGITANQNYSLVVTQGTNVITRNFYVMVNPGTLTEAMPTPWEDGINYFAADPTQAVLVLDAPNKDFVYVAGSFNGYQPSTQHAMKKDPATGKFWLRLTNLTANAINTYQYWVVDQTPIANSPVLVKTADPYSTLVLNGADANYPAGQEREVTVLQTAQPAYNWQVTNFTKPAKEDLVIYEVLVRDFDAGMSYQSLIDKIDYFKNLKVNAIELMPVMEYEGDESWGYNTSFHMAADKFYGTQNKLKEFIDLCHQNGIAVIMDVALNHAFGSNPMNRMWMTDPDGDGWGSPSTENPYFNTMGMHSYNVGSDFNHQQPRTRNYVRRVLKHWIEEFNIDGFRWDLTKGFTQNCPNSDACTNGYQQDRVDVLKEYVDYTWNLDPTHYAIFEHLGQDNEEREWANYRINEGKGIMMWGIMNSQYNELSMG